jgi:hypothetical protein
MRLVSMIAWQILKIMH